MRSRILALVLIVLLLAGCGAATSNTETEQALELPTAYDWPDYRKSFDLPIRVFQYKRHKIQSVTVTVDLPANLLAAHDTLTLEVDIRSGTKGAFEAFSPYFSVNESTFYNPPIPVTKEPQRQTVDVTLKTEHLQPGPNTLRAGFRWNGNYYCSGVGCGYVIWKMAFKDMETTE
jgi:uncharacterized protein YceK